MHKVYLGLGSNLGDREANLGAAIKEINNRIGSVLRQSDFIHSAPQGYESDNDYLNAVIVAETSLSPEEVLAETQQIEHQLGRRHKRHSIDDTAPYHDRTIDIDILIYEGVVMNTSHLTLPHPRIAERPFVSIPLAQVME